MPDIEPQGLTSSLHKMPSSALLELESMLSGLNNASFVASDLHLMRKELQGRNPNIIVFGQTGTGKSSLINMLAGKCVAQVSSDVDGCTPVRKSYDITGPPPDGNSNADPSNTYTFWDTCGLNEGDEGTVNPAVALDGLHQLVYDHGANMLLYCIRGSRFTGMTRVNYDLVWGAICSQKVPIVLVITGLEQQADMDDWWHRNKKEVDRMGMTFEGYACVTTIMGRNGVYKEAYNESTEKVWTLVQDHCSQRRWRMPPEWHAEVPKVMKRYMQDFQARTGKEQEVLAKAIKGHKPLTRNIILFGETGAGKSSIVNMLVGEGVAEVSSGSLGCTFQNKCHDAIIGDATFRIYDTVGLNEGDQGRVPHWKAIEGLYTLIRGLDGVSLLIYCLRGRITGNTHANWILFNNVICGGHVPIIIAVTGLENEDDWEDSGKLRDIKKAFEAYQMKSRDVASAVPVLGKSNEHKAKYERSQTKLRNLIKESHREQPWSKEKDIWFADVYRKVYTTGICTFARTRVDYAEKMRGMFDQFIKETGMKEDEYEKLADTLVMAEKKFLKQEKTKRRTK